MQSAGTGGASMRIARGRSRQRELYGAPLGDRVRRLTATLGVTQARLARALGISPAMLSQLVSARRVKIGDPAVLARLQLLDRRCAGATGPPAPAAVEALLDDVARARLQWTAAGDLPPGGSADPATALRSVAPPARLVAAAATLGPAFPELAAVLRRAAAGAPAGTRPAGDRPRAPGGTPRAG